MTRSRKGGPKKAARTGSGTRAPSISKRVTVPDSMLPLQPYGETMRRLQQVEETIDRLTRERDAARGEADAQRRTAQLHVEKFAALQHALLRTAEYRLRMDIRYDGMRMSPASEAEYLRSMAGVYCERFIHGATQLHEAKKEAAIARFWFKRTWDPTRDMWPMELGAQPEARPVEEIMRLQARIEELEIELRRERRRATGPRYPDDDVFEPY